MREVKFKVKVSVLDNRERYYPACPTANKLCAFRGMGSLSVEDMHYLRQLDYKVMLNTAELVGGDNEASNV